MDQTKGQKKSGLHTNNDGNNLICEINNASILAETKMEIIEWAVAKCPKVCISTHGIQISSLLDCGSEVTLLWQSYFNKYIQPKIKLAMGKKANAHSLFKLTVANDGQMPIKMYIKLNLTFWGLKVLNVCKLIAEDPNQLLGKEHQRKLPGIVHWNLIWLSYNTFIQEYGTTGFDSFKCPEGVYPLLFSKLCVFHYSDIEPDTGNNIWSHVLAD